MFAANLKLAHLKIEQREQKVKDLIEELGLKGA